MSIDELIKLFHTPERAAEAVGLKSPQILYRRRKDGLPVRKAWVPQIIETLEKELEIISYGIERLEEYEHG